MPTYEYECKSCSHTFDAFQSMADEPLKTCPKCGKQIRRLINGGTGVIFKGSGFYVTDRGSNRASVGKTADKTTDSPNTDAPSRAAETKTAEPATTETKTASADNTAVASSAKPEAPVKAAE
ncbi:MAG: zinc ribbon domain-containing protein [Treponema sp.]|jgi:putative FmdB family regulatory protein|nr:zinc ribbon domain-containing protein [Treponema sp.]MDR0511748.1 zinc ribbon domain-containing protein [Treponema sp.]